MHNLRPRKLGKENLLDEEQLQTDLVKIPEKKTRIKKYLMIAAVVLIAIVLLIFWSGSSTSSSSVFHRVLGQEESLQEENGLVNILLLGIGGGIHDGPNLTDSMMVASFNPTTHQVNLISLPRDIWIDTKQIKINALYQLGLNQGNGVGLVQEEVGNLLGIKIPYAVRIDFDGFIQAVDLVGGIDVNVTKTFEDYLYPLEGHEKDLCGYEEKQIDVSEEQSKSLNVSIGRHKALVDPNGNVVNISTDETELKYTDNQVAKFFNCRFEHLDFKEGKINMDGTLALKYVRSRHGTNGEGNDFARSKRQQQVLQAFKEKVLSIGTLSDPQKLIGLIQAFGASLDTNISSKEYLEFAKLVREIEGAKSYVIDASGTSPLLISPDPEKYGGAWVLVPDGGNYNKIHQYVNSVLTRSGQATNSGKER